MTDNALIELRRTQFAGKIYDTLFDDAAWLYEQRLGFFEDTTYLWTDMHSYELRLTNFLDALMNRGPSVDLYCQEKALEDGDYGNVFAAIYMLGKRNGLSGIRALVHDIDCSTSTNRNAIVDAVNLTLNKPDLMALVQMLFQDTTPESLEMAAGIINYHRLNSPDIIELLLQRLNQLIASDDPASHDSLIQLSLNALGKLMPLSTPATQDLNFLYQLIDQEHHHDVLIQLVITLFKTRHSDIFNYLSKPIADRVWPILPLGVYGQENVNGTLWHLLNNGTPEQIHHAIMALGLIGSVANIDVCLQCLAYPDYAEPAAEALQLMTGADLYEEIFVPDEIDPDMLFFAERACYDKGEPVYPPGEEPGQTVIKLVQDEQVWRQWYEEHKDGFVNDQRYRYGQITTRESLIDALKKPQTSHVIRRLIVDELAIQHGIDVKIDTNMFVAGQKRAIEQAEQTHPY